jgi:macrolide-specific efflux system membrane fusion protein
MKKITKQRKISLLSLISLSLIFGACQPQESTFPVRKNIEEAVFASGFTEQENNYTVSANSEGIILSCPVKEGDTVKDNDLIAVIENEIQQNQLQDAVVVYQDAAYNASPDSPKLQHLQSQIDQARQQLAFDKENYQRYKGLRETNSVSQFDLEKIELQYKASQNNLIALQKNYEEVQSSLKLNESRSRVQVSTQKSLLADYQLRTGISGRVIRVFKKQGELVRRGEALVRIGSGDYIIKLFISEDDITKINLGHPVAVNLNTYPNRTFPARVTKIYPAFDESQQSYLVEARFDQLPEKMFSGTQLQANIETGSREEVLVIPADYVSRGSFVVLENGEEKQIVTGNKNGVWTEVISGISENEKIVKPTK